MYCKKCGKRAPEGAEVCECGAKLQIDEYCGGFWGLLGKNSPSEAAQTPPAVLPQTRPAEPVPPNVRPAAGEPDVGAGKQKKGPRRSPFFPLMNLVLRLVLVVLLILILQTLHSLKNDITERQSRLESQLESVCETVQEIQTELEERKLPAPEQPSGNEHSALEEEPAAFAEEPQENGSADAAEDAGQPENSPADAEAENGLPENGAVDAEEKS